MEKGFPHQNPIPESSLPPTSAALVCFTSEAGGASGVLYFGSRWSIWCALLRKQVEHPMCPAKCFTSWLCASICFDVAPPPLCKHGRGRKKPGKTAVHRPPGAWTRPCSHVTHMTANAHDCPCPEDADADRLWKGKIRSG